MASHSSTQRSIGIVLLAVGLALSGACGVPAARISMGDAMAQSEDSADLDPMDPKNFDTATSGNGVEVKPSLNKHCQMAIKHMYNEDWSLAEEAFRAALEDNAEDERAMFGLAVTLEKQQRWREASNWYKAANLVHPRTQYTQGWRRVKPHLQGERQRSRRASTE